MKSVKLKVESENLKGFKSAVLSVVLMEEVLGMEFLLKEIIKTLPKKYTKRIAKKKAKKQYVNWKISLLKDRGLKLA